MSLLFTFTSTATHYFPKIPSDEEFMPPRDDESETELSKTAYSRSQTPSPESTITNLMNFIVDATINHIPTPAEIARATITAMAPTFRTQDMMIHHLSSTTGLLTPKQRDSIAQELDEFADVARESGLPLIPQEIIDGFLERTCPQETAPGTATEDVTTITHNPAIVAMGGTIVPIATAPVAIDATTTTTPARFTMETLTNLINASEDLDLRPSSQTSLMHRMHFHLNTIIKTTTTSTFHHQPSYLLMASLNTMISLLGEILPCAAPFITSGHC